MTAAWRHQWAQAVRTDKSLSATARLVAQSLALDFANGETGQCNPSRAVLADHLGMSEATIKRALGELTKAGWLGRHGATARNRTANYTFTSPGKVVAFAPPKTENAGHRRPASEARTRVKSEPNAGHEIAALYKNHVKNHRAREAGDCPVAQIEVAHDTSHRAARWNAWLAEKGWPSLAELGVRASDGHGHGWRVPFALPPEPDEQIRISIAEKYVAWAAARAAQGRAGVA
ncbi:helix-turn-helix domain-containing protein [Rhodosalinus sp. K401]|uniref:helix-turn-helix domain-containing protein n=1 Tax=Rhodosalinus sp. K401 TaxID=3239195 RepID=UPI0035257BE9